MATSQTPSPERLVVPALKDGFRLAVSVFRPPPKTTSKHPAIIIAQATGVPARFYSSIAAYLASQGSPCVTFDFRCCGASFPPSVSADPSAVDPVEGTSLGAEGRKDLLKAYPDVGFDHWGTHDYAAVLLWAWASLCDYGRERELVLLGNSLGGHLLPFALRAALAEHAASGSSNPAPTVRRALFIGSTSPYYGFWPDPKTTLAQQNHMLKAMKNAGFMDCTSIGFGNDIPLKGGQDWIQSSSYSNYTAGRPEFRDHFLPYRTDTLSISFSDDHLAHGSPRKIDAYSRTLGDPSSVESAEEKAWWELNGDASGAAAHAAYTSSPSRTPPPFFGTADVAHERRRKQGWLNTRLIIDVVHQGWVQGSPMRSTGDIPAAETDTRPRAVGHTDWPRAKVGQSQSPSSEVWEFIRAYCQDGFVPKEGDALLGGRGDRRDFGAQVASGVVPQSKPLSARL